jgi:dihydroflavonol-4-reductase
VGDVLDPAEQLAEAMAECDWVFHAAAVSDYWRQGKDRIYQVNVDGTKNVLAAAQMAGIKRLVFTSSATTLGLPAGGQVLNEDSQFNLKPDAWPYAHSKHLAEDEVRRACDEGLNCVMVLPTITIGARDVNLGGGSIITETARGLARVYPPGGSNFAAVADVAGGHIAAAELGHVGERYILGGENLTYKQVLDIICEIAGRPSPRIGLPTWSLPPIALLASGARAVFGDRIPFEPGQVRLSGLTVYFDSSKAVTELGLAATPFRVAAQQAYDWYNGHGFLAKPPI